MSRLSIRRAVPWFCVAALAACAAPQAPAPAPQAVAPAPAAPAPDLPPPAEELESYALVRDDPAVAATGARLAAATRLERPAVLMERARRAIAAGQKIRTAFGNPIHLPSWAPDYERFLAFYELAARDLAELLAAHPAAPEAAEAQFTRGLIHDYPHLDLFDEALLAYRLTVQNYPGTPWAGRARERIAVIEGILDAGEGRAHGEREEQTGPGR